MPSIPSPQAVACQGSASLPFPCTRTPHKARRSPPAASDHAPFLPASPPFRAFAAPCESPLPHPSAPPAWASSAVLRPPSAAPPQSQFLPFPPLGESCCYRAYIPASPGFCHSIQNTLSPAAVHSRPHYRDKSCPACPLCPSQKAPASPP